MRVAGVVLTPGAGTGADHPSLVHLADGLTPVPVRRMDFGYRKAGRKAPPRAERLVDEIVEGAEEFATELGTTTDRLVLGGRSMGGRVCSMAIAGGLPAAGLVCLAYPLHPPGKPDKLRIDHLPELDLPCLFVSGTRDPFGSPQELREHLASIPGPTTIQLVDGAGHDLERAEDEVLATVSAWLDTLAGT